MTDLTNSRLTCGPTRARRPSLLRLLELYRQRRALAALDARALDDLGLTAHQARTEAARPFWDLPAHLRR